jgi:CBS domain-containing protein
MTPAYAYPAARLQRRQRVEDVMTTAVVTADRLTPYQEVARLLVERQVSCLPVLAHGWQVIGVVSETDLLAARDGTARRGQAAGELMTAPPVTIRPDAALSAAARVMTTRHVTSLPVTGADRELIGIVSRRDLLSVFLRPDGDITGDIGHVLDQLPLGDPPGITTTVRHGVVTLAGVIRPQPGHYQDLLRAAIGQIRDIDGVVDVVTRFIDGQGSARLCGRHQLGRALPQ